MLRCDPERRAVRERSPPLASIGIKSGHFGEFRISVKRVPDVCERSLAGYAAGVDGAGHTQAAVSHPVDDKHRLIKVRQEAVVSIFLNVPRVERYGLFIDPQRGRFKIVHANRPGDLVDLFFPAIRCLGQSGLSRPRFACDRKFDRRSAVRRSRVVRYK